MGHFVKARDTETELLLVQKPTTRYAAGIVATGFGAVLLWLLYAKRAELSLWLIVVVGVVALLALNHGLGTLLRPPWIHVKKETQQYTYQHGLHGLVRDPRNLDFGQIRAIELEVFRRRPRSEFNLFLRTKSGWGQMIDSSRDPDYVNDLLGRLYALIGCPILRDGRPRQSPYVTPDDQAS